MAVLVLDEPDLKNQAPEDWVALFPQVVLWVGPGGASRFINFPSENLTIFS
jgi:hypothetical protein